MSRRLDMNKTITCSNGDLYINFTDGKVTFRKIKNKRKNLIRYIRSASCPHFESFISDVFAVNRNPKAMKKHFLQVVGWLMFPTSVRKINWIFYGHDRSGKYQLLRILEPFFAPSKYGEITITNRRPRLSEGWEGEYVIMVIPFHRVFSEHDLNPVDLEKIVQNEMSGILNMALDGLTTLIRNGRFYQPAECIDALNEWTKNRSVMERFVSDNCIIDDDLEVCTHGLDIYKKYLGWKEPFGEDIGKKVFYKKLRELGAKELTGDYNAVKFSNVLIQ